MYKHNWRVEASLPSGANEPILPYICIYYLDGTLTHTVKLYVSSNLTRIGPNFPYNNDGGTVTHTVILCVS